MTQLYSQMDELKREVQHRGVEVEVTRKELQLTVDIKVHLLMPLITLLLLLLDKFS